MRNVSFGTPAQFQSKLKEKIQELGGDVSACENIKADQYESFSEYDRKNREARNTQINTAPRDVDLFLELYNDDDNFNLHSERYNMVHQILNKYGSEDEDIVYLFRKASTQDQQLMIDYLKGTYDDDAESVTSAVEPGDADTQDKYIQKLQNSVESDLEDLAQGFYWDSDDNNLYLSVKVDDSRIWEYTIPIEDLKLDFADMDVDVSYIADTVRDQFKNDNGED